MLTRTVYTYIHTYISKKWWQSGSTGKYSVEALCARSSLLRVNNILSYMSNYPHIYIYICIYLKKKKKCWKVGELRGIICAWSSLFRALGTWYRRCTRRGLSPRGGGVHFRNEKSFRTRGPQNRFGMKIIAAVSSLPAIHS